MKIVVLQRENKKRLLIDTLEVPDYQDRYLQEDGTEFGAVEVKQKKPKKKAVKKAVKKVAKKPSKSSKK